MNKYSGIAEAVAAPVIVNNQGELLLIKSHKWGDKYLIPGGHIEVGETIFEAAKREGEEETGLKLEPQYCVNVGELIYDPDYHRKAHLIYFHVVCKVISGEVKLDGKELKDFTWVNPQKALDLNFVAGVKKSIENFMNGVKIDIESYTFENNS